MQLAISFDETWLRKTEPLEGASGLYWFYRLKPVTRGTGTRPGLQLNHKLCFQCISRYKQVLQYTHSNLRSFLAHKATWGPEPIKPPLGLTSGFLPVWLNPN